ncbi:MAG: TonB-dependent receptor [Candidatus Omnitrophica bacterium]|nr:TonB-dependent receptor [Candidatus Omnitrophota bacterium]
MKNSGIPIFVLTGLSVCFALKPLFAAEINLSDIVVTPSRTEESAGNTSRKVDVITSADIASSGAKDLSEALTQIAAIDIIDYGGIGGQKSIRMRGSTSSQVLVLMDGRPLNSPRDGSVDLSNIPVENVERMEVVYGPTSNLYGSSAMGGTVNIITKNPPKEKQETQFTTSAGTFQTYLERLVHGGRIGHFGYLVSGGYESSGGFRTNTEFNSKDFNTKLEYEFNDQNDLLFSGGFLKSLQGVPGPVNNPDVDDKQRNLKNYLDLAWSFKPDKDTELTSKIYNNYDRLEFMPNRMDSVFDTGAGKSIHATQTRGINLQLAKELFEKNRLVGGLNYTGNFNDSTDTAKHKYNVKAAYLDDQFDLTKKIKLSLGVRVDDYSNFGTQASPSFTFLYKFNENNKLHSVISRSFRAPTFNDLYWPNDGFSRGNPNLKPEKGATAELGFESRLNKYYLVNLTYYRSNYDELINWAPESPDPLAMWSPNNIGSAVIQGAELEQQINLTDNLEAVLGYTYLLAKDRKTHKFLNYQPQDKADFSLKFHNLNGLMMELKGQFTGKRFHDANNSVKVKQFFSLGFSASKKFKHGITYYLNLDNLLGKKYQVVRNYPAPGFSVTNGLKFDF